MHRAVACRSHAHVSRFANTTPAYYRRPTTNARSARRGPLRDTRAVEDRMQPALFLGQLVFRHAERPWRPFEEFTHLSFIYGPALMRKHMQRLTTGHRARQS